MEQQTTEYVGRHRRPHDQLSPLLKRHLAAQRELEVERRRAAALQTRNDMFDLVERLSAR
jgi:hypothetical protein